jgi:hypothetical protein
MRTSTVSAKIVRTDITIKTIAILRTNGRSRDTITGAIADTTTTAISAVHLIRMRADTGGGAEIISTSPVIVAIIINGTSGCNALSISA